VDNECHPVVFSELSKIDKIMQYVTKKEVCVQAGGNVGVFPKRLATIFDWIYTFEPDLENFECLIRNIDEFNIGTYYAALGDKQDMIRVGAPDEKHKNNCGAYQVLGEGDVPVMRIDDLDLPACDLIYLDIEGYEYFAIQGAIKTIEEYRPVIALEQKPLPMMYGLEPDSATEYLVENHNYELTDRLMRDNVLVPR
jgi:FkbM family methyltransferase